MWVFQASFCTALPLAYLVLTAVVAAAQEPCPPDTVFEPYSETCAPVNDRRAWWLAASDPISSDVPPEAGAINAGTTYLDAALVATSNARLHTKMFVYPDGLQPTGFLDWTFTTATNRVDSAVEVVAIYRTALGDSGVLSIFGRPCSTEFPCPDGDTSNGWQPSKYFSELGCNITHIVDDGGHAQKVVHYANHSDRLDDGDPPLWKNAVYLWNYCAAEWDLIWDHTYRENKRDCSVEGCYWWGTGLELPGSSLRPQVTELGFEDTRFYHDGTWSQLGPNETGFRDPEDRPDLSPWQLFHLDPNRSFGAGNFLDLNDPPAIVAQAPITADEDTELQLSTDALTIVDPDVDPAYHAAYVMTIYAGNNYTHSGDRVVPTANFFGNLSIPVSVSDGAAESATVTLLASVVPVDDSPIFTSTPALTATEAALYAYDVVTVDPDLEFATVQSFNAPAWLTLNDNGDGTAILSGIPSGVHVGDQPVELSATDGSGLTATQSFTIDVAAAPDGPVIEILGANPMSVNQGEDFSDPGATASDIQDGDLTASIITAGNVNTAMPGTYEISYSVSDTAGHTASAFRTVLVRAAVGSRGGGGGGTMNVGTLVLLLMVVVLSRYNPR